MSERMEEMLAKLIQLQKETVKEIKINNRMLSLMHIYGVSTSIASFKKEELDFIASINSRDM